MAKDLGVPAEEWFELKRRRRKESWERIKEIWRYADHEELIQRREEQQNAALAQERLERADALEREAERRARSQRQRRLNERSRERARQLT